MDGYKYMVRVSCMTYNHASYIEDAMNGFCMQETSFPFVCTIVDDASTDGEQEVIKNYLQGHFDLENKAIVRDEETDDYFLTFAQHKTNKNCFFVVLLLKYNHFQRKKPKGPYYAEWCNTKYIALCEGDDYWIVPDKLQRQVFFLDNHTDYAMCFHGANVASEDSTTTEIKSMLKLECREYSGEEIYDKWTIPTASVMFLSIVKPVRDERFIFGDTPLFLSCTLYGKIGCFDNKPLCVYRRHQGGASSTRPSYNRWINHHFALKQHFPKIRNCVDKHIVKIQVACFFSRGFNNETVSVSEDLIRHPRYIVPALIYTPFFIINYIKGKMACQSK